MIDPITAMTAISLGLKLVDQFRELALRFSGKAPTAVSATVEQANNTIQVKHNGIVTQQVRAEDMHLDAWNEVVYRALERRVKINWDLFYELYSQEPLLGAFERAQIKLRMENTKQELCVDFRQMVAIYEYALNTSLPDHYKLYETCN